jgi:hypothetical protein
MESRDRVISIVLSEQEWQAFVQSHPQPVEWLRQQILRDSGPIASSFASAPAAANRTSATTR